MTILLKLPSNTLTRKLYFQKYLTKSKRSPVSLTLGASGHTYNIGCTSWGRRLSKSTILRGQLWVPTYLALIISRGICKGLSSWHLPGQIWASPIIYPYMCIRGKS